MSDFKFPCPKCGQNILCDSSNAGMQIPCPGCQQLLTVPPAPPQPPSAGGKLSINKAAHAHSAPPPPPPGAAAAPAKPAWGAKPEVGPQKMSRLAVASLICSLTVIGWLPGIICGHMAKTRIRNDRSLKGWGYAKWGVITGYLMLVLTIAAIGGTIGLGYYTAKQMKEAADKAAAEQQAAEAARVAEEAAKAKRAGWKLDLEKANFPDRPASGKLHTVNFTAETILIQGGTLALRQDSGSTREFVITIPLKSGESIQSKSLDISSTDTNKNPKIAMIWKDDTNPRPVTQIYTNGYALKLEFGAVANGKLPGKIYLCLPDADQSYVAGNFEFVPKSPGAPNANPAAAPPGQRGAPAGNPPPQRRR